MAPERKDSFSNPQDESAVMNAWHVFLDGGERPVDSLRALVDASWQRSLDARVDPRMRSGPRPLAESDLYLLRERQRELLEASAPVMAHARDFLAETGTLMAVADTCGTILNTEGDLPAIDSAEAIHLMPGVTWSEGVCGTNAIGTALAVGKPVQIHSAEHFCEGIKHWTCSATVMRHPLDGEVVGVLDVSGLSQTYNRQTLALVVTAASRIEARLAAAEMEQRYRLLDQAMGRLSGADGVVLFDRRGNVVRANEYAALAIRSADGELELERGRCRVPGLAVGRQGRLAAAPLPSWMKSEWLEPLFVGDKPLGTLLVVPRPPASGVRVPTGGTLTGAVSRSDPDADPFAAIVTTDPGMLATITKARQLARARMPVLLQGETGVGKEVFARGIHGHSGGPFVALNCGGLSRELLASELFGYADGAFTGARKGGMAGKIEAADGGTLFLDEIGEMPLDMQPALLRVLEQGEIYRLGENTPRRVNFRLVAATYRDLRQEIAAGRFRMDLFYRIAVMQLRIPALRERQGDIEVLVRHFLERFRGEQGQGPQNIDPDALGILRAYPWPGNVRELRNLIEGLVMLCQEPSITCAHLPHEFQTVHNTVLPGLGRSGGSMSMAEGEEALIRQAIQASGGNLTRAARKLQIAKSTLYAKMQRYGLSRDDQ
ncbi:MAG: sigma-54-dependent Fis family transcriptional regulator [Castellaniella sp.]|uniref:sigma-54-dependent Fis family transcriptional regulator n=1 Tax=Castellaniella sp. TaxID=1955812 RepID=UPI002A370B2B|nr:sigma-54-dependent Fis family transcriptional regulator [Castellaniella sp.]MDY0309718.1 sigma-54-dependent Fis family transcriptional regulator [Castellaniella sp.]